MLKAFDIVVQHLSVTQEVLQINNWAVIWVGFVISFLLGDFIKLGRMDELASISIWTVWAFMELLAKFGLIPRRNVLLLLELVITVSKSASVTVRTVSISCESSAQLSLDFDLVILGHYSTVVLESKWIMCCWLFYFMNSLKLLTCEKFILELNLIFNASHLVVKRLRLLAIRIRQKLRDVVFPNWVCVNFGWIKRLCFNWRHGAADFRIERWVSCFSICGFSALFNINRSFDKNVFLLV